MSPDFLVPALFFLFGSVFLCWVVFSLRSESYFRHWYGVDPTDESAVRSNAIVVGVCGLGMCILAGVLYFDVPERLIGTGAVIVSSVLCIILGWLIRYRDRRDLLTTPNVDRPTAHRLGGVAILCGILVLPLAPAIWVGVEPVVLLGVTFGATLISLTAVVYAYGSIERKVV